MSKNILSKLFYMPCHEKIIIFVAHSKERVGIEFKISSKTPRGKKGQHKKTPS